MRFMMNMFKYVHLLLCSFILLSFQYSLAAEKIIQPGPGEGLDTWVTSVYSGYGQNDHKLRVGGWADYYYSLIKFNINESPQNILSAKIHLYSFNDGHKYRTPMYLDRVTSRWDESTKWQQKPSYVNVRTISAPLFNTWYQIDISDLYRSWKKGIFENHGIQLRPTSNNDAMNAFYSSDYALNPSLRPKLVIEYSLASTPATQETHISKVIEGWASQTGYRNSNTEVQKKIVQLAKAAIGSPSGQSVRNDSYWLTDVAEGDGERMLKAIRIYHDWCSKDKKRLGLLDADVKKRMLAEFGKSKYGDAQKDIIIQRIVEVYKVNNNIPISIDEVLRYLGIQKQCLEWAITIAQKAGGKPINYRNARSVKKENIRPGMGYYNISNHAMIIIDVLHDKMGNPIKLKVAESNNRVVNWVNPKGDIPWKRTITVREVGLGFVVVDYENN